MAIFQKIEITWIATVAIDYNMAANYTAAFPTVIVFKKMYFVHVLPLNHSMILSQSKTSQLNHCLVIMTMRIIPIISPALNS